MTIAFGQLAPDFTCPASNSDAFHFNTVAGRYVILSFLGSTTLQDNFARLQQTIIPHRKFFDDQHLCLFGITIDPRDLQTGTLQQELPGIRYFWDFHHQVSAAYGALTPETLELDLEAQLATYQGFTLLLDPNLRTLARIPYQHTNHDRLISEILANLPSLDHYAGTPLHAPVLIVPRVFEPAFCEELVNLYCQQGGQDSGFMREIEGKTTGMIDHNFKKRQDYEIEDEKLKSLIRSKIIARLLPEIEKAFQFRVTRMERYIISCYDAQTGGFFRPHRDNTTKGTAHRRFAVTINLNSDEYQGGDLRFPEFGTKTYRAPTGGAIVFSCSLLHEAMPVTQGQRYAFLPFLYDEEAARIREANQQFLAN